nr:hypothetical protein [Tanacetum cinerariifolium]
MVETVRAVAVYDPEISLSMTQMFIRIMKHPTSSTNLNSTNTRHTRVEIVLTMDLIVKHGPRLSMSMNRVTIKTLGQLLNQNFYEPNHCYNSNSFGFDQSQPPQFPFIYQPPQEASIEILHDQENAITSVQTFLRKFNHYSFFETPKVLLLAWDRVFEIKDAFENKQYKPKDIQELFHELFNDVQNIHKELAEYINTPGWNRPAFCNNGDDDDEDCTIAVTPDFPITDSLIMENEHLNTIPETESDEFIKSSVENLVSIPSESEDFSDIESECDMPDCDDSQTT